MCLILSAFSTYLSEQSDTMRLFDFFLLPFKLLWRLITGAPFEGGAAIDLEDEMNWEVFCVQGSERTV